MFNQYQETEIEKKLLKAVRYLEWNSQRDGVITTKTGLQFKNISSMHSYSKEMQNTNIYGVTDEHSSAVNAIEYKFATDDDKVVIHYQGQYLRGVEFDNSVEKNRPITVHVRNLVQGLKEGVKYMMVGDVFEFYLSPELGYGDQDLQKLPASLGIAANSALIYNIKLLNIIRSNEDTVNQV